MGMLFILTSATAAVVLLFDCITPWCAA